MSLLPGCFCCDQEAAEDLPVRERVHVGDGWRVAHAFDTSLPGWLVVLPRRHVTAMAELTDDEGAELGVLLVRLGRALSRVTGCTKTYVMQFAEAPGFGHVHLHVVPRMADQPEDRRGPAVFGYLGVPEGERVPEDARDRLAGELAAALTA
ncbi:HIT family protein [Lapillicoccus jejuensis]|uniref:Diadenosine tetraphosphate (Ap4A) HIT family hydrolase n=1 Tax=Lapillicoccus jejuensis TaxID=402171 RepID=A0A542E3W3_9MICO|nr:HIT family protein [Lapillicoccus jejuensis]TQJ10005.1 diadenosine tetraphosphate (Ap4A) HIT family hydrolase [Lapillicoccus jejuensis]